jgi:CelD/BcsL family acetyltransferase involved in cellulose biosynthesis
VKVSVVCPHELGAAKINAWRAMQRSAPDLMNPFLSPGFTLAVARVRPDTRVAVLEDGADIVGFFPFEYTRVPARRAARPVCNRVDRTVDLGPFRT